MAALTPLNSWQDRLKTQIIKNMVRISPFLLIEDIEEIRTPIRQDMSETIFIWHTWIFDKEPQEKLNSLNTRQVKELVISIFHGMIPNIAKEILLPLYVMRCRETIFNKASYINGLISNTPLKMARDLKQQVEGSVNIESSPTDDFEIVSIERPSLTAQIALLEKWRDNPSLVLPPERFL